MSASHKSVKYSKIIKQNRDVLYKACFYACYYDSLDLIKVIINSPDFDINKPDHYGRTLLHWASIMSSKINTKTVRLLLKQENINVNIGDDIGLTPLYFACRNQDKRVIRLLLKEKCIDVNKVGDGHFDTPLHMVCHYGPPEILQILLEAKNININAKLPCKTTPLHLACRKGRTKIVRLLLLEKKIDINTRNKYGTPLELACSHDRKEVIKLLLCKGACTKGINHELITQWQAFEKENTKGTPLNDSRFKRYINSDIVQRAKTDRFSSSLKSGLIHFINNNSIAIPTNYPVSLLKFNNDLYKAYEAFNSFIAEQYQTSTNTL